MNFYSCVVIDPYAICQPTWVGAQPVKCDVREGQVDGIRPKEPLVKPLGNHAESKFIYKNCNKFCETRKFSSGTEQILIVLLPTI